MRNITITSEKFPKSDLSAGFTGLVNGCPVMEFSIFQGNLGYRTYGAGELDTYTPLKSVGANYKEHQMMNDCRLFFRGFVAACSANVSSIIKEVKNGQGA
jgi:hypothetical protein